ncbi:MAG: hypothetical protein V4613_11255 [Bacteroidota bacterium]
MKQTLIASLVLIYTVFLITGCKDNPPSPSNPPTNETELITTFKLIFTDTANSRVYIAYMFDADGLGPDNPSIFDSITLDTGRVYKAEIVILDETKNPVDSVSNEILNEADDHLFVFKKSGVDLTVQVTDKDSKNLPLGLVSYWTTGAASKGTIQVLLKHQPGVKDGTEQPGETDIDLTFNCRIK